MSAEGEQPEPEPPTGYRRDGTPYWSKGQGHGGPARGGPAHGVWPKQRAEPGNTLRLDHGARSPRVYQQRARELAEGLLAQHPWLGGYPEALAAWSESEARASLLREWLSERDLLGEDGNVLHEGALTWLRTFERQARQARKDLGLDPASEAAVAKARGEAALVSADLDAIRQAGREALGEADVAPGEPGDGGGGS